MMKIYDISIPISRDMTVYKNKEEKRPVLTVMQDYSSGHSFESRIEMDLHTGTHLDAPLHMLENGATVDKLDLSRVITSCKVIDLAEVEDKITGNTLAGQNISAGDFVLFKTRNSFHEGFDFEFVYLDKTGAEFLAEAEVAGVGIDALGIERNQPEHETHTILFANGIVILEGLKLKDVPAGEYLLYAAPLNIVGAEAAPVRAVLIEG